MCLSFGTHAVELKSWETKSEMLQFLAKCDSGSLLLGEDAEQEMQFLSALVSLEWSGMHHFGIGICSEGHGLSPHLLLLPNSDILLFGFNNEVSAVSIKTREVAFRIKLDSLFYSFLYMRERGVILAVYEIGVMAITESGRKLWKYEKDIIMDAYVESDNLQLKFMDDPPVNLNISSGELQRL